MAAIKRRGRNIMKKILAILAMLVVGTAAFAEKFPSYLKVNGTTITGYDKYSLPKKLMIPEGITEIGKYAFRGCTTLESVTIPASLMKVREGAFSGCTSLKKVQYKGTLAQWCRINNNGSLTGYAKSVKLSDVSDLKTMTALTVPDGVTAIGEYAFSGCTALESVTIPTSLTEISNFAFNSKTLKKVQYKGTLAQWCQAGNYWPLVKYADIIKLSDVSNLKTMTELTVPDGVTGIYDSVFKGLSSLESVIIPASVKYINSTAFEDCTSLKKVQYKGTLAQWCQINNSRSLIGYAKSISLSDVENLKTMTVLSIPKGVKKVGYGAFEGFRSLESVTIPEGVTEIGSNAFSGCTALDGVTIPASVTEIGSNAFKNCPNLIAQFGGTQELWSDISSDSDMDSRNVICADTFESEIPAYFKMKGTMIIGCDKGRLPGNLVIPKGVSQIGDKAFEGCEKFESVTIPMTVTRISSSAFEGCAPRRIQYDGTRAQWSRIVDSDLAFKNVFCTDGLMGELEVPAYLKINGTKIVGCDKDALPDNLTIPDGVTEIAGEVFTECMYLESVMIPGSVKRISSGTDYQNINKAKGAFMGCTSLKSVVFMEGVEEIGDGAFLGCLSLANVTIPDSMKRIGHRAFMDCKALANITLPEGITEIGTGAFNGTGLKSVTIPGSVTSMGSAFGSLMRGYVSMAGAFSSCTSLESVTILGGAVIGERAFMGCTALRTVTISEGVTTIGAMAFLGCTSLTSIVIPSGVTAINGGVFSGCTSLAKVTIPDTVKEIKNTAYTGGEVDSNGYGAFSGCTSLTSITIPENVTEIGDYAFCASGLTSVTIPGRVKHIGGSAFAGCESLTSVTIPRGVSGIGGSAFAGCKNLRSISIPRSVVEMGGNVFGNGKFEQNFDKRSLRVEHRYRDDYIKEPVIPYPNLTIQFDGTKAQWKFEKQNWDESWHGRLSHNNYNERTGYYHYRRAVIIRCTDGNITIPE